MSATLPNMDMVSHWLDASFYVTDFRPIPLTEFIKMGNAIYDSSGMNKVRQIRHDDLLIDDDADHTIILTLETVCNGHGVLVFCPTKNWCEKLAEKTAKQFFNIGRPNCRFAETSECKFI